MRVRDILAYQIDSPFVIIEFSVESINNGHHDVITIFSYKNQREAGLKRNKGRGQQKSTTCEHKAIFLWEKPRRKKERPYEPILAIRGSSQYSTHAICESKKVNVCPVAARAPATRAFISPVRLPCRTMVTDTGN